MTIEELHKKSFLGTTIEKESVRKFVKDLPNYLGWAYDQEADEMEKDQLNRLDFFEFHYRRYLLGSPQRLHRVMQEVRSFRDHHPSDAHYYIKHSIKAVKAELLKLELFELIPRMDQSAKKIERLLPNPDTDSIPLFLLSLEMAYPGHEVMRTTV